MKILGKIQRRAAIWILGAFKTSPTEGLKAIMELISIKLHLHKLTSRSQLHSTALLENHLIKTLIDDPLNTCYKFPPHSINMLTDRQKISVKGHLMDSNNKLYRVFPSFPPLMLWQPLITKTNDHTSSKSLKLDIKWEVHKRTQQGVSAKLESYIY